MDNDSRMKLSVIIPCYNEENNIRECLESVVWADEILVVDSFSTDRTLEIARSILTGFCSMNISTLLPRRTGPFHRPFMTGF